MTDKFISPCSQPELLEAMAIKAHNKQRDLNGDVGKKEFDWDLLSEDGKQDAIECMAAALEVLKGPPEKFLAALASAFHDRLMPEHPWDQLNDLMQSKMRLVSKDALKTAITQAIKEGE